MDAKGKVVVITGASMGIGEALAHEFVGAGANVVLSARDAQRLEHARARVGSADRTMTVVCDVQKRADLDSLLKAALDRYGRVDVWINNAGFGLMDSVAHMDIAECRRMFDTNLFGAIEAMQAVIPVMQKQGSGAIINISSIAGHIAVPYMAAYSATKHALSAIGKAARVELQSSGVHVMTVCPGYIATNFSTNAVLGKEGKRMQRAARMSIGPERVARAVFKGYLNQRREVIVPWTDRISINLYRCFPKLVEAVMAKSMRPAAETISAANPTNKTP